VLGQAFSVSESYAHKRYCYMRRILAQVLDMPAGLLGPPGLLKVDVSSTWSAPGKGSGSITRVKKKTYR